MKFWRERGKGRGGRRDADTKEGEMEGMKERRDVCEERVGLGVLRNFLALVLCVNTLLIQVLLLACVRPHCPDWVCVCVRDSGGLHMSLFEESLRKSRTWLRPFSGRLRNLHHRGPLCMSLHSLRMLLANTYGLMLTLKVLTTFCDISWAKRSVVHCRYCSDEWSRTHSEVPFKPSIFSLVNAAIPCDQLEPVAKSVWANIS